MRRLVRPATVAGAFPVISFLALASAPTALAHGLAALPPLDVSSALTSWTFEPFATAGLLLALVAYLAGVRRVDRAHPANPVPRLRIAAWCGGLAATAVALSSFVDVYATALFSVHMVQHLILVFLAAPLLCLGAPVTLVLRVAPPELRQRRILPLLHSRILRFITHPVIDWILFAAVMWVSHFSPLFDAALENPWIHAAEHLLYLATAFLFWWPVVGADPAPSRMGFPLRTGYVLLAMPQNAFLGLALFSAGNVLYPHYATNTLPWLPDALADQQLAGGIMWVAGDILFLVPLLLVVLAWLRDEERKGRLYDQRLDPTQPGAMEIGTTSDELEPRGAPEAQSGIVTSVSSASATKSSVR